MVGVCATRGERERRRAARPVPHTSPPPPRSLLHPFPSMKLVAAKHAPAAGGLVREGRGAGGGGARGDAAALSGRQAPRAPRSRPAGAHWCPPSDSPPSGPPSLAPGAALLTHTACAPARARSRGRRGRRGWRRRRDRGVRRAVAEAAQPPPSHACRGCAPRPLPPAAAAAVSARRRRHECPLQPFFNPLPAPIPPPPEPGLGRVAQAGRGGALARRGEVHGRRHGGGGVRRVRL